MLRLDSKGQDASFKMSIFSLSNALRTAQIEAETTADNAEKALNEIIKELRNTAKIFSRSATNLE